MLRCTDQAKPMRGAQSFLSNCTPACDTGFWPIGRDHDGAIQIEVADATVGGRSDVVAKPKIDGQIGTNPEIVLHKSAQVPVAGGIKAREEVLFVRIWDAEQAGRPARCRRSRC